MDNQTILKNRSLAQSLNLRGTPALIINDNLSPGIVRKISLILGVKYLFYDKLFKILLIMQFHSQNMEIKL